VPHKFIRVPAGGHVLYGVPAAERTKIYDQALAFVKEYAG
jgi:dipeptidyl aminopeptidase/acylaminoacyl peptidase